MSVGNQPNQGKAGFDPAYIIVAVVAGLFSFSAVCVVGMIAWFVLSGDSAPPEVASLPVVHTLEVTATQKPPYVVGHMAAFEIKPFTPAVALKVERDGRGSWMGVKNVSMIDSNKETLKLAQDVGPDDTTIRVTDARSIARYRRQNSTSPTCSIAVGSERMDVLNVDPSTRLVTVQRTNPTAHRISEPLLFYPQPHRKVARSQWPVRVGNLVYWTPTADDVGKRVVHIQVMQDREKTWYTEVTVVKDKPAQ